jgi:hypothetical protein
LFQSDVDDKDILNHFLDVFGNTTRPHAQMFPDKDDFDASQWYKKTLSDRAIIESFTSKKETMLNNLKVNSIPERCSITSHETVW